MPLRSYTEGQMKAVLMDKLRMYRGLLPIRIEDTTTSGLPDIWVAGGGKITTWEVKLGRPDYESKEIQHRTCCQLEQMAHCRYIIFQMEEDGSNKRVTIVRPSLLRHETLGGFTRYGGFNHDWVVAYVVGEHR